MTWWDKILQDIVLIFVPGGGPPCIIPGAIIPGGIPGRAPIGGAGT